jgi:hypothetical protein
MAIRESRPRQFFDILLNSHYHRIGEGKKAPGGRGCSPQTGPPARMRKDGRPLWNSYPGLTGVS